MSIDIYVPRDASALSLGAAGVARAVQTEAQVFVESALHVAGFMMLPAGALDFGHADDMMETMKEAGRLSGRR